MIKHIFVLLGSNIGQKIANLDICTRLIEAQAGKIKQKSSIYETAAWGKEDQESFVNQVLELETQLDPLKLLEITQAIELKMGRERYEKWGPRIIDIDILFFDGIVINYENLVIPHPQLHLRRFTLEPLHEIVPKFVHPVLNRSISDLLEDCPDTLSVEKLN